MKTPLESLMTEDKKKLVKRWTIGAAVFYGIIVTATVALIAIGINASDGLADSEESMANSDLQGYAVSAARPNRSTQLSQSNAAEVTTGYNSRVAPAAAYAAPRSIPEVDEMGKTPATPQETLVENGWDFNAPHNVPGFAPMQAGSAPSAALPQLTARERK